jgi:6-phosphogluconolactonase
MNFSHNEIKIFNTRDEINSFLAEFLRRIVTASISQSGQCTVALSGGSTPRFFYEYLALEKYFPWDKIHFFIVDERFVNEGSNDHNFTMMRRTLFARIAIDPQNLHPIDTTQSSSKAAAEKYDRELQDFFSLSRSDPFPSFDLILLGIGTDGHTASLFPGSDALLERNKCAIDSGTDAVPHERITMTFPVLDNAKNLVFVATGSEKQNILRRIFIDREILPASMIQSKTGKILFVCDSDAAQKLPKN